MKKARNNGIDVLRILSMFFVLVCHIIGKGGIKDASAMTGNSQFAIVWLMYSIIFSCVNVFALISGYVGYRENDFTIRFSNLITLWFQVFFYGFIFMIVQMIFEPNTLTLSTIAETFMPAAFGEYWYFSAYFALFFFSGLLNRITYYSSKEMGYYLGIIIVFFSFYSTIASRFGDPFDLKNGYSFMWLAALYLLGAWMKKNRIPEKVSKNKMIVLIIVCILLTFGVKILCSLILPAYLGERIKEISNLLIYYLSPTMLGYAFGLVCIFANLKCGRITTLLIRLFAPVSFGVYIIHEDYFVKSVFIVDKFSSVATIEFWKIPIFVVIIAIIYFFMCSLIDWGRIYIFKLFRIKQLSIWLEIKIRHIATKIIGKILKDAN